MKLRLLLQVQSTLTKKHLEGLEKRGEGVVRIRLGNLICTWNLLNC
jgi:hypothetical protein